MKFLRLIDNNLKRIAAYVYEAMVMTKEKYRITSNMLGPWIRVYKRSLMLLEVAATHASTCNWLLSQTKVRLLCSFQVYFHSHIVFILFTLWIIIIHLYSVLLFIILIPSSMTSKWNWPLTFDERMHLDWSVRRKIDARMKMFNNSQCLFECDIIVETQGMK